MYITQEQAIRLFATVTKPGAWYISQHNTRIIHSILGFYRVYKDAYIAMREQERYDLERHKEEINYKVFLNQPQNTQGRQFTTNVYISNDVYERFIGTIK